MYLITIKYSTFLDFKWRSLKVIVYILTQKYLEKMCQNVWG